MRRKGESAVRQIPNLRIVADQRLKGRRNMTTGANKDDHHLRGVDIERDIQVDRVGRSAHGRVRRRLSEVRDRHA